MVVKSENPLLAGIQDLITKKFDLESWPSDHEHNTEGHWVDVHVYGEESYIFTVGVVGDHVVLYRPGMDGYDNRISLYDEDIENKILNQIEEVISTII